MRMYVAAAALTLATLAGTTLGYSQNWTLGGNLGLSLLDGSVGFHFTPMAELLLLNRNIGIGSEISFNTQFGMPMLWHPYFKYYIGIRGSKLRPYAHVGPVMALNVPNGPCFGILFGGGVNIPLAHRWYLAPDILVGPVFGYGGGIYPFFLPGYHGIPTWSVYSTPSGTILTFSIRGGVRYEI